MYNGGKLGNGGYEVMTDEVVTTRPYIELWDTHRTISNLHTVGSKHERCNIELRLQMKKNNYINTHFTLQTRTDHPPIL